MVAGVERKHSFKQLTGTQHLKSNYSVDYNNILCTTFIGADPESAKKTDYFTIFFVLLRSECVKAAQNIDEIDP